MLLHVTESLLGASHEGEILGQVVQLSCVCSHCAWLPYGSHPARFSLALLGWGRVLLMKKRRWFDASHCLPQIDLNFQVKQS